MSMKDTPLAIRNISKTFGAVVALKEVCLDVRTQEILAIVGDNGAGKTTLIKILAGTYKPDSGTIYINGKELRSLNPSLALKEGITTVYQDLALVESQDVTTNVFLGNEYSKGPFLDRAAMKKETRDLLRKLRINIPDIDHPISYLSGGQKQGVAVARALRSGGSVFIFDEPTAAMGVSETQQIQSLMRGLAEEGLTVLLVSHNLSQVFEISDRIAVLRHGRLARVLDTKSTSVNEVLSFITGVN